MNRGFFLDQSDFRAWRRTSPLVTSVNPNEEGEHVPDQHLPYIEVYYWILHPSVHIVRAGRTFCLVKRCATKQEANFQWVHKGEPVYATFLRDVWDVPLCGSTLQEAKESLGRRSHWGSNAGAFARNTPMT